ncbi:hypothetical protein M569_12188, partial [Genlisea aurea]
LPGRTDNDIKNYWNTRLRKKLLGRHRKQQQQQQTKKSQCIFPLHSQLPTSSNSWSFPETLVVHDQQQQQQQMESYGNFYAHRGGEAAVYPDYELYDSRMSNVDDLVMRSNYMVNNGNSCDSSSTVNNWYNNAHNNNWEWE